MLEHAILVYDMHVKCFNDDVVSCVQDWDCDGVSGDTVHHSDDPQFGAVVAVVVEHEQWADGVHLYV